MRVNKILVDKSLVEKWKSMMADIAEAIGRKSYVMVVKDEEFRLVEVAGSLVGSMEESLRDDIRKGSKVKMRWMYDSDIRYGVVEDNPSWAMGCPLFVCVPVCWHGDLLQELPASPLVRELRITHHPGDF